MRSLLQQFFAEHPDLDQPKTRILTETYFANWVLSEQPSTILPKDVFIFGGKGSGKTTFTGNFIGEPMLMPVAGEISNGLINATALKAFAGAASDYGIHKEESAAIEPFALWAGLPVARGASGFGPWALDGYGRNLSGGERARFGTADVQTPIHAVHLFFCDSDVAVSRVHKRADDQNRDPEAPSDSVRAGQAQPYYLWPSATQHAPRVFLWDGSTSTLKLMGLLETNENISTFHRANEVSLQKFGLSREACHTLWNLNKTLPHDYDSTFQVAVLMTLSNHRADPWMNAMMHDYSLDAFGQGLQQSIKSSSTPASAEIKINKLKSCFGSATIGASLKFSNGFPAQLQRYRTLDPLRSWKDQPAILAAA